MSDSNFELVQQAADVILFSIAERAGVKNEDLLAGVEEEFLDTMDEVGNYGMEVWTVFEAETLDGQTYFAHLPGTLDRLLAQAARESSAILRGQ